jgi:hypothetical protein
MKRDAVSRNLASRLWLFASSPSSLQIKAARLLASNVRRLIRLAAMMLSSSLGNGCGRLLLALCVLGAVACGEDSKDAGNGGGAGESGNPPDETGLTGTFTIGTKTLPCTTSDQDFPATGEYSVLCESEDSGFVQVTFKNEAAARTAQDLTFMKPFAFKPEDHEAADAISVSYMNAAGETLDSDDESTGSAKVAASDGHHVLTLKDVSLSTVTSEDTGEVSATINF